MTFQGYSLGEWILVAELAEGKSVTIHAELQNLMPELGYHIRFNVELCQG